MSEENNTDTVVEEKQSKKFSKTKKCVDTTQQYISIPI